LNPFDQWGVERGKTMASRLKPAVAGEATAADTVTNSLITMIKGN
jgi:glucose-6-phosphate isomerase